MCAQAGIDERGAELVQHSMNVVYRLDRAGLVLRLANGSDAAAGAARLVRVAGELDKCGAAVIRLAPGLRQPMQTGRWSATAWMLVPAPRANRPVAADLAAPLKTLHGLPSLGEPLPTWDLLGTVRNQIGRAAAVEGSAREAQSRWAESLLGLDRRALVSQLTAECNAIGTELARTAWALPSAVVHGDAHTGNLLRTPDGTTVLCDLDTVAWGPPEADLAPAAHGKVRFRRDPDDYARFADRYEFDVLAWSGWPVLRRLRDLQLAVYLLPALADQAWCGGELAHRIRSVLAGDERAIWHRYPRFA